jgi:hypothetical protein
VAANSQITILTAKKNRIDASMKKLPPPTFEEMQKIQNKYNSKMQKSLTRFARELTRIMSTPGLQEQVGETLVSLAPT